MTGEEIKNRIRCLSEKEREVMDLRYGMSNGYPMTQGEIAQKFLVTRERIRQIERRAVVKMSKPICIHCKKKVILDTNVEFTGFCDEICETKERERQQLRKLLTEE